MIGILLMAYGSPESLEDVEDYYTRVMKGRRPSKEQIERLKGRYSAIGGSSPLTKITASQAHKLQQLLASKGDDSKVYFCMKYSKPFIKDAVAQAKADGIDKLVCLPIVPFYSLIGTGSYFEHVDKALKDIDYSPELVKVSSWNEESGLVRSWVESVSELGLSKDYVMLFTAHSLPITERDDLSVYRKQLIKTSNDVQRNFGNKWSLSFQSAADIPGNWLGPDAAWQIEGLARSGVKNLAIIPIGFVSDNLETMYDVGVEYASLCRSLGIEFKIAKMPNDSSGIIEALYSAYKKALSR